MRKLVLNKSLCKALLLFTVIVVMVLATHFIVSFIEDTAQNNYTTSDDSSDEETQQVSGMYYNGEWYDERDGISTWLFIGIDKYYDELEDDFQTTSTQADYLILYVFDDVNETYQTIHINRDSMVSIDSLTLDGSDIIGEVFAQITLAFTYGADEEGGSENVVRAASELLYDTDIDNYLTFTLDVVPIITEMVGGVEVEILDDYTHLYEDMIEGETVTLSGEQALAYIQTRYGIGDQTNLERMERQAQYMEALEDAVREKRESNSDFYLDLVLALVDYIFTDASLNDLDGIIDKYSSYENTNNYVIDGESIVGDDYNEYYVDEDMLKELMVNIFYTKDSE